MTLIHHPGLGSVADDAERASERAVYLDGEGKRRIVAAGDPVPEGWELEASASLEDAAASTVTAQDDATVGTGGQPAESVPAPRGRGRRKPAESGGE